MCAFVHIPQWKWQKCWRNSNTMAYSHDSGRNGCRSSSSRFSKGGNFLAWKLTTSLPQHTHTHMHIHTILPNWIKNNTESVITLIQWLFFLIALAFYLGQAVCLCIVTGGAKHIPVLLPYSVGVRHQNIFIIKMLTICGLCSARIYNRFKSPHPPGEQNKECY